MKIQSNVGGVVLAGGQSKRMGYQDKGLLLFNNLPMVSYGIRAMTSVADKTVISANRNLDAYQQFGLPVLTDSNNNFDGPLAGILTAMDYFTDYEVLLVTPCDCPLVRAEHLQRLLDAREYHGTDVAVAVNGDTLQPLFLALKSSIKTNLKIYLSEGNRKVISWLCFHTLAKVNFSSPANPFFNVNTPNDIAWLQQSVSAK